MIFLKTNIIRRELKKLLLIFRSGKKLIENLYREIFIEKRFWRILNFVFSFYFIFNESN